MTNFQNSMGMEATHASRSKFWRLMAQEKVHQQIWEELPIACQMFVQSRLAKLLVSLEIFNDV